MPDGDARRIETSGDDGRSSRVSPATTVVRTKPGLLVSTRKPSPAKSEYAQA